MSDKTIVYKVSVLVSAGGEEAVLGDVVAQSSKTASDDFGKMQDSSHTAQTALLLNEVLGKIIDVCQVRAVENTADWIVEGYTQMKPDTAVIEMYANLVFEMRGIAIKPDVIIEELPDIDWVAENQKSFKPVIAGQFFIHSTDYDGHVPSYKIPLILNAGAAFGTGGHGTTSGCLQALTDLGNTHTFKNILDVGTGTGILALGAAKIWRRSNILATDIDPTAVDVTKYNMTINQSRFRFDVAVATGMTGRVITKRAPYDLIIANILAGPLRIISVEVVSSMSSGGLVVLSGIWGRQKTSVLNAYRRCGLILQRSYTIDNWHTLVMKKP